MSSTPSTDATGAMNASASASASDSANVSMMMIPHRIDRYGGVIIDDSEMWSRFTTIESFESSLTYSLTIFQQEHRRGIWLKIPRTQAKFIPIAVQAGFDFHHTQHDYLMCTLWLATQEKNMLPAYCSVTLGVGAFVINKKRQVLAVTEKYGFGKNFWKLPGGAVDEGEDLIPAAIREVKEETGVDVRFECILTVRHMQNFRWNRADLYFICLLQAIDDDQPLLPQAEEIEQVKWMEVDEFLALPHLQFLFKHFHPQILHEVQRVLQPELNLPCHGLRAVPVSRLMGKGENMLYVANLSDEWYHEHKDHPKITPQLHGITPHSSI